jgi:hypothetical protein
MVITAVVAAGSTADLPQAGRTPHGVSLLAAIGLGFCCAA